MRMPGLDIGLSEIFKVSLIIYPKDGAISLLESDPKFWDSL